MEPCLQIKGFTVDYVIHHKCFAGLIFVVPGQSAKIVNLMHLRYLVLYSILMTMHVHVHTLIKGVALD